MTEASLRPAASQADGDDDLRPRFRAVRARTLALAAPLSDEDMGAQSMADASPAKWHLAHTTWFWETFVLVPHAAAEPFDRDFRVLFNSYYNAVGAKPRRDTRGLHTRPGVARVKAYRAHVDALMMRLLSGGVSAEVEALVRLGLAHEEQHQELLLTDVLHLFAQSPLKPAYDATPPAPAAPRGEIAWRGFEAQAVEVGREPDALRFAFDNETPRHLVQLPAFRIADRLTTNAEWAAFIDAGGYREAALWLSDGWDCVSGEGWEVPLYWERDADGAWREFGLHGLLPLDPEAPVRHVSYYEADAYARWRGMRLPTEFEWEHAARSGLLAEVDDTAWQWTASAYLPYPGFEAALGAVGEYNGKFMINQMIVRGGSLATAPGHASPTTRSFFGPEKRWQFTGVRLAADRRAPGDARSFRDDVLEGLSLPAKTTPPKWLYDEEGSRLFDEITRLAEYYPTRTETALLAEIAPDVAELIPEGAVLVEFGSGSSTKTPLILQAAQARLAVYAPIDISIDALAPAARAIADAFPTLKVEPIEGDFTQLDALPQVLAGLPRVGFFPGSTVGNFTPEQAEDFLRGAAKLLGPGALFLVGVDLEKAPAIMVAAYDDAEGVTAAFNLNLLTRINRELDADFDTSRFMHRAVWNAQAGRMEMRLESLVKQTVHVAGRPFHFRVGESLHTENSYKTSEPAFQALAGRAGWSGVKSWRSAEPYPFAVMLLRAGG